MALWLIRTAQPDARIEPVFERGLIAIGGGLDDDIGRMLSFIELKKHLRAQSPDATPESLNRETQRLWSFLYEMEPDDLVGVLLDQGRKVRFGRITGPYRYDAEFPGLPHTRTVEWVSGPMPVSQFQAHLPEPGGSGERVLRIEDAASVSVIRRKLIAEPGGKRYTIAKILVSAMLLLNMLVLVFRNMRVGHLHW